MKGIWKDWTRALLELAASQPAVAESIALVNLDDPGVSRDSPDGFRWILALAQFARGAVAAASETFEQAEEMCLAASDPLSVDIYRRLRIKFSVLSDGTMPMPGDVWARDTTTANLLSRGLRAAITGDQILARRCLEGTRGRPRQELARCGATPSLLEARLATMSGRPEETVRLLRPIAVQRVELGRPTIGVGLTWVRWFLADAFEQLDRPDSAAVYLERIWGPPFLYYACPEKPWAHRRLALLYARLGRIPDAERHLAAVDKAWDRPDPEVRKMLEQARAAVAAAKEMVER